MRSVSWKCDKCGTSKAETDPWQLPSGWSEVVIRVEADLGPPRICGPNNPPKGRTRPTTRTWHLCDTCTAALPFWLDR